MTMRLVLGLMLLVSIAAFGCGNGNDNHEAPAANFQCTGPEGPPTFCLAGNVCCGNQCTSKGAPCCEVPAGLAGAGNHFACASNQKCCGGGCGPADSPCS